MDKIKPFCNYARDFATLRSQEFYKNQNYKVFSQDFQKLLKIENGLFQSFQENLIGCNNHNQFTAVIDEFIFNIF
jgi:hypothetical protein